jgi:hypothetical protein
LSDWKLDFVIHDKDGKEVYRSEKFPVSKSPQPIVLPWMAENLWSCDSPYLYTITTRLYDGDKLYDEVTNRFGFREFTIQGPDFYLNGVKMHLFGDGWHHRFTWDRQRITDLYTCLKRAGIRIYRAHQPHPDIWYDVADEMGFLLVAEGPMHQRRHCDSSAKDFWPNAEKTYTSWVRRVRNHPSLVIYSANNEVVNGFEGYQDDKKVDGDWREKAEFVLRLAEFIKKNDKTRPIMHEGDGWLMGRTDIVNIHYPHEAPFWCMYPQAARWLEFDPNACTWKYKPWDRTEPLYIGEFGKAFDWTPRSLAFLAGDKPYRGSEEYYRAAGDVFYEMIVGLRLSGCSGIAPWSTSHYAMYDDEPTKPNPMYYGIARGFKHEIVIPLERYTRFYSGRTLQRTFAVLNDSRKDQTYTLQWNLRANEGEMISSGTKDLAVPPAGKSIQKIQISMPRVDSLKKLTFEVKLIHHDKPVDTSVQSFTVFPKDPFPNAPQVTLVGFSSENIKRLETAGLKYTPKNAGNLSDSDKTILVGPDALNEKLSDVLTKLAANGANVILLKQTAWPKDWLGMNIPTERKSCTIAFARTPANQALTDLDDDGVKFWASDHVVSDALLSKPGGGPLETVVDSASNELGLKFTALASGRVGKGVISVLQMNILDRLAEEPAAAKILANLISLPPTQKPVHPVALIHPDPRLNSFVQQAGPFETTRDASAIVLQGSTWKNIVEPEWKRLKAKTESGSTVLVTAMSPEDAKILQSRFGIDVGLKPKTGFQGHITPDGKNLFRGLGDDDFCWVVYDEWGSEYRHAGNKRWPLAEYAFEKYPTEAKVLLTSKPVVLNGDLYGDTLMSMQPWTKPLMKDNDPLVIEIPIGRGKIILSQLLLEPLQESQIQNVSKMIWENSSFSIQNVCNRIFAAMLRNMP